VSRLFAGGRARCCPKTASSFRPVPEGLGEPAWTRRSLRLARRCAGCAGRLLSTEVKEHVPEAPVCPCVWPRPSAGRETGSGRVAAFPGVPHRPHDCRPEGPQPIGLASAQPKPLWRGTPRRCAPPRRCTAEAAGVPSAFASGLRPRRPVAASRVVRRGAKDLTVLLRPFRVSCLVSEDS
jgi:hypothetical protein